MNALLIANRGEIAVRIIRTARELGMRTIAVYSELDRDALHTKLADEAWNIGPAPSSDSYLNQDRILEVARESGADAIHPGYGFMAENGEFAQRVTDAGLIWVGPSPAAIRLMGDKISSRRAAEAAGVLGVPGNSDPVTTADEVKALADQFGYPVAIKAAHGGGGKGLKVVKSPDEVQSALDSARREADAYFGNAEVYVEKYLERPRHIEAQILFDTHGNGVFLGERDCSVQRRHQKLIEESPSPSVTPEQRKALGEAALAVARAADYVNAGTVEFLMDKDGSFFFLEMNTRIQVEHAVTEMVTGIDLVREQLRIAMGEELQSTTSPDLRGHAIEFRVNAEDASRNFMPSPGIIVDYYEPGGFGVRVDSGVVAESAVSQYYDNLIAKLIVWAPDREQALARGKRALEEYRISGIPTTIPAHLAIIAHPTFRSGDHYTKFVEDEMDLSGLATPTAAHLPEDEETIERRMLVEVGGRRYVVRVWTPSIGPVSTGGQKVAPRRRAPKLDKKAAAGESAGVIIAPMQGTIVKVHKKAGESVVTGEALCVLEAMKMENEIKSPVDGEIVELRIQAGDTVSSGAVLLIIK